MIEVASAISGVRDRSYEIRQHVFQDEACIAECSCVYVYTENSVKAALPADFKALLRTSMAPV
jgi:acyl-CoA thioesterase FadM